MLILILLYPVTVLKVLLYLIVFHCCCVTTVTLMYRLPCDCAISATVCYFVLLCYYVTDTVVLMLLWAIVLPYYCVIT